MAILSKPAGIVPCFSSLLLSVLLTFQSSGAPIRPGDTLTQISPTNVSRSYVGITDAGTRLFRATSRGDVEMSEDNGATWNDRSPGVLARLADITWTGSRLVAVGRDGLIISSDDLGLSWQNRPSNASGDYYSVAWTGTHLLATGINRQTSQSADAGNTWETYYFTDPGQFYGAGGIPGAWALVGTNGTIFGSTDNGESWYELYTTGPSTAAFYDFVFTGSEYIIVGESGTILRSTNLAEWTPIVSGTTAHLQDLHWNGFQLFACGGRLYSNHSEPETLLTSSDGGLNWTTRFSGNPGSLRAIAGGASNQTAVGLNNLSTHSTDGGITWSQPNAAAQTDPPEDLEIVINHNGTLVGMGNNFDTNSGAISTSSDGGRTWTERDIQASRFLLDITSVGNRLVVVASAGKVRVSDDNGSSWMNKDVATSDWLTGVADTGTAVIAVGTTSDFTSTVVYRSSDQGNTWSPVTYSVPGFFYRVAWTGSSLVAVGSDGIMARSTDDGLTWSPIDAGTTNQFNSIATGPGYLLAGAGSGEILRSVDDGLTWQPASAPNATGSVSRLIHDETHWFGISSSGLVVSSDAGLSWETRTDYIARNSSTIALQGSTLILVNPSLKETYSSSDAGASWRGLNVQTIRHINAFAKKGDLHVAVGDISMIMTSTDRGDTWTIHSGPTASRDLRDLICTAAGTFVAVGDLGEIATSTDGMTWTKKTFPNSSNIQGVASDGSMIVAVADDGNAYRSTDNGESWMTHSTAASGGLYDVTYGNGEFIAVGQTGVILTSPTGVVWTPQSSGTSQFLWEVIWTGVRYVVAGGNSLSSNGGGIVLSSDDGSSWNTRLSGLVQPVEALAFIGSRVIGMGSDQIAISDDGGLTWSSTGTSISFINTLHWDGQRLLIGCSNKTLWHSEGNAEGLAAIGLAADIQIRDASDTILSNPAASIPFGSLVLNSSSESSTFTIENIGNATLNTIGIAPSGTNPNDFPINSGSTSTSLDPGASTTFTLSFSPAESGARSASIQIGSNDPDDALFLIPVTGTGNTALELFNAAATTASLAGGNALPEASPKSDSVTNLEKYAFNMDLSAPDSHRLTPGGNSGLPHLEFSPNTGQWTFSYIRRRNSGLLYSHQSSSTLETGTFATMPGTPSVTPIDSNWERVTVEETITPATTPKRFGRVEVLLP